MFGGDAQGMFAWGTLWLEIWGWVSLIVVCLIAVWMLCAMLRR